MVYQEFIKRKIDDIVFMNLDNILLHHKIDIIKKNSDYKPSIDIFLLEK